MELPARGLVESTEISRITDLLERKQYSEAESMLRQVLKADPRSAPALRNLGVIRGLAGSWKEAARLFERAASLAPRDASIWADLGLARLELMQLNGAASALREALVLEPDSARIRVRYARVLFLKGRYDEAAKELRNPLRQRWSRCESALRLQARILTATRRVHEALSVVQRIVENSNPAHREDLNTLAALYGQCGKTHECLQVTESLMASGPVDHVFHSAYLTVRLHSADETIAQSRKAAAAWGRLHPVREWEPSVTPPPRGPRRRPVVGYVSREFHQGPALHFFLPLLRGRDKAAYQLIGYCCGPTRDAMTTVAAREFDKWRECHSIAELRRAVLRDKPDILVDLSGHWGGEVPLFQERLAPVQMAFPCYPGSTGAKHMDFILTDRWVCPKGNERQYTERPIWLEPGYLPYEAPHSPEIPPLPFKRNGYLTFALLQRPAKMTAELYDAIAQIMTRTPRSRLLIHYATPELDIENSAARRYYKDLLGSRGISPRRLQFRGPAPLREHMEIVATTDIALDTFPYNGQTTTCECLWMGVPVISQAGDRHVARVGWQTLDRIGRADLVAQSWNEYIERAVALAEDVDKLDSLRSTLRDAMRVSRLMNGTVRRSIEAEYRRMV